MVRRREAPSRTMKAPVLVAILRDARKSALLWMRTEIGARK
jgi:hypothetical protein